MDSSQITIRPLCFEDLKAYKTLRLQALQESSQAFDDSYELAHERPDSYWKEKMESFSNNVSMGAFDKEKLVGVCCFEFDSNPKIDHLAEFSFLYVSPQYQNSGIGSQLLQESLEALAIHRPQITQANLHVCTQQKAAIKLYERFGFEVVTELKSSRKLDGQFFDDYLMTLFIK